MATDQDELVITLRKPVKLGTETYERLVLREPTAGELMQWDQLEKTEADIKAVATVSGIPEPAVRMIGARDLIQASRFIGSFLD